MFIVRFFWVIPLSYLAKNSSQGLVNYAPGSVFGEFDSLVYYQQNTSDGLDLSWRKFTGFIKKTVLNLTRLLFSSWLSIIYRLDRIHRKNTNLAYKNVLTLKIVLSNSFDILCFFQLNMSPRQSLSSN